MFVWSLAVSVNAYMYVCVVGSCLLRIIDSFGTEPAFNYDVFAKAHHLKTQWGMQNLNPQQFFTMFRLYRIMSHSL